MATLLQITNQVLKRLREDAALDLTTEAYHNLVGSLVADMAAEVNESMEWGQLDHEVTVAVLAATRDYDLGGSTTDRSRLLYDSCNRPMAYLFDDGADTEGQQMIQMDWKDMERRYQHDRDLTNQDPLYFSLHRDQSAPQDGWHLKLWPEPTTTRTIRIWFNTPEAELDVDTDEAVEIKAPNRPIMLGALYLALNERGEEIGEPGNVAEQRYLRALASAREDAIRQRERTGSLDWYRD